MKVRTAFLMLLPAIGLLAAGCSGRVDESPQDEADPAPTEAPGGAAVITAMPASPIPVTPTPRTAPSVTTDATRGVEYETYDHGYGEDEYGYGSAGATSTAGSDPIADDQARVGTSVSAVGMILVDGRGYSLYALTTDPPGVSTCLGSCLEAWPPLLTEGNPIAEGNAKPALLGTVVRKEGGTQVTYAGKPLYLFAKDLAAGDLNGHGVGGVWYALTVEGGFAR